MPFTEQLNDEIGTELDALKDLDVSDEEYKTTVDGVTKLIDRAIKLKEIEAETERQNKKIEAEAEAQAKKLEAEMEAQAKKLDAEMKAAAKAREDEYALRMMQMRDERLDKIARNVLTGFTFGGTMFTIWCLASATFTFEEKGTITSSLGRKVLGMLVPKIMF